MQNRKLVWGIIAFLLFLALVLGFIIFILKKDRGIEVFFLDVGQGDAILIQQGANQVLIDGGRNGTALLEGLGKSMPFWDREIEAIIVTHPDIDHYGGLMGALDNYSVKNVIKTDAFKEGKEWKIFEEKIKNENASEIKSVCGMELIFSNGAKFQVVYPLEGNIVSNDSNNYSVVTKMDFGENSFLFTGDIERETENILINSGIRLDADFLKVSHHGSKSSSSDEFLDAVSPEDAIISAGAGNPYNHPHKETLKKLENRLVRIWRTDKEGRIIYKCRNKNEKCRAFAD